MKFVIVTHVPHISVKDELFAYAPYIREMNVWGNHVDSFILIAPESPNANPSRIQVSYKHQDIHWSRIPSFSFVTFAQAFRALFVIPIIFVKMFLAFMKADHIHLRCPGNVGLLGCVIQVFFPKTKKTAKYAGNWDPDAKQPLSYRLQKWILSNTFLSRNMKVLVYGDWPRQTRNVLPFFTATYQRSKNDYVEEKEFKSPWRFVFIGTLSPGKRPLYAVKIVEELNKNGILATLDLYGEGVERNSIEVYLKECGLEKTITIHGNQATERVEEAYRNSHFLLLPSKSEGWPKVVAEAMFFGVIPITTKISCVPWMLDNGNRGILLTLQLHRDVEKLIENLSKKEKLKLISNKAKQWSQQYTLERFQSEIEKLL